MLFRPPERLRRLLLSAAALVLQAILLLPPAPSAAAEPVAETVPSWEENPTFLLQQAIRTPNSAEIERALNAGAAITEESLWLAAIYADPEILKFLLKRIDVSAESTFSISIEPAPNQDPTEIGLSLRRRMLSLLSDGPPARFLDGVTLLHVAALSGNTEVARFLLEEGVHVNSAMSNGGTAITVAYCSWLRAWNPMRMAEEAFAPLRKEANYPGFIYYLLDSGANPDPMEDLIEKRRDAIERYLVTLTAGRLVTMRDGSLRRLGDVLEDACTRTAWGLIDYQVFGRHSSFYCKMTVVFFGRLKSDGSSIRVPFVFLDDKFLFPGDPGAENLISIMKDGALMTQDQVERFWTSLGIVQDAGREERAQKPSPGYH